MLQPVSAQQWVALSRRVDVALWCLQEDDFNPGNRPQPQHGLLDRRGNVTVVGRAVLDGL